MTKETLYSSIVSISNTTGLNNLQMALRQMCALMAQYLEADALRMGYDGTWYMPDEFHTTPNCRRKKISINDHSDILLEVYYSRENFVSFDEAEKDGTLETALALVKSYLVSHLFGTLSYEHRERKKELRAINYVTEILNKDQHIKETLQQVADAMPASWQYPEITCVRIVYENFDVRTKDYKETRWSMAESFVTLDNKNGIIQVCYKEERPAEFDGPFLKEELQLIMNISRLVCGYINNYKGRELYNNFPKKASTAVSEDFRKTLTKDKKPLQLFFNKQMIEKYVYLDMMKYKVKNILFVATLYDAFTLENDDSFFEQFMGEIYQYSLFSLPRITGVSSSAEALELMESTRFDLAILMVGLDYKTVIDLSENIKARQSDIPVYLLLNKTNNLKYFEQLTMTLPSIDKLFVWSGNSQILFSIVKSIEDNANVENDTKIGLVRVILLVEDSPVYYSKYLQLLFGIVFGQVQKLLGEEERNEINKISKMRQRPKILHARNYEDAMYIYEKYKDFLLCVISDLEFEHNGKVDNRAGEELLSYMTQNTPTVPMILQTSDPDGKAIADLLGVEYLDKNSESIQSEIMDFLTQRLGFGDFFFRSSNGKPLAQAKGMKEFERIFRNIPIDMLARFCRGNRISSWIMSRGEIPLARRLSTIRVEDYEDGDMEKFRSEILEMIGQHTADRRRGKKLDFDEVDKLDERSVISMASGSLGGKGRGLAFINTLIQNVDTSKFSDYINLRMPLTAIIGTDEFSHFMERGDLYPYIATETDYMKLRAVFANVPLSDQLMDRLHRFVRQVKTPIAVRSSSLSEDSMNQPFAGVFDTYLVPNNEPTEEKNVQALADAIRMVYASIYSDSSRAYFQTIRHNIEEEKMAVVLQALVGNRYDHYFYPHAAGTAQSYNYYPVAHMKPDEGFAVAGFGLGYYVVGGSKAYRFSPAWPNIAIMSTADMVKTTQVEFLAVDLDKHDLDYVTKGESAPLATLDISEAEKHGTLKHCASVYNPDNDTIEPGLNSYGPRIVNFADILKYDYVPLAKLLSQLLVNAKEAMGSPVEIEWALDLEDGPNDLPSFYLLQMKPIVSELQGSSVIVDEPEPDKSILYTTQSLGNGEVKDITDIIYVDPETFDHMQTETMVKEIEYLNNKMIAADKNYVLIGPGRWGTRDKFIGIPVQWAQISKAKMIVEMSLPNFPLDSSLGSHFFHNVTSMNIGYLSVQDGSTVDYISWNNIKKLEVVERTPFFCHVRASEPLVVKMNGKDRKAVVSLV
ncbi:MAG: pyruvate, phosphate dikinase [Bacteroidales bacterium]|nr:pyruvate, phosphate dikinase [Bacteroidales bacterium]